MITRTRCIIVDAFGVNKTSLPYRNLVTPKVTRPKRQSLMLASATLMLASAIFFTKHYKLTIKPCHSLLHLKLTVSANLLPISILLPWCLDTGRYVVKFNARWWTIALWLSKLCLRLSLCLILDTVTLQHTKSWGLYPTGYHLVLPGALLGA